MVYKWVENCVKCRLSVCRLLSFNNQLMTISWRCVVQCCSVRLPIHGPYGPCSSSLCCCYKRHMEHQTFLYFLYK